MNSAGAVGSLRVQLHQRGLRFRRVSVRCGLDCSLGVARHRSRRGV